MTRTVEQRSPRTNQIWAISMSAWTDSTSECRVTDAFIAYVRGRDNRNGNALRRAILQLSFAGEDGSKHSQDVFPRMGRADGDVVPRVRARFGVRAAQDVRKDALIEVDEIVQTHLARRGE